MKFGVLTGGGDCPGLNAAIRGVVFRANLGGHSTLGFLDGWKGVRDDRSRPLSCVDVALAARRGGTLLGSSRTNPFAKEADTEKVLATLDRHGIDVLVAIGGDDTLRAARELHRRGRKVVGVPKTMDNDVAGTDWTFGFDSASTVAVEALERLADTAESHHRAIVLEVMGREAGWVALATGLAGGADCTLVPEEPYDEERMLAAVRTAVSLRGYALVVVSEGIEIGASTGAAAAGDEFGHELLRERAVGAEVAKRIETRLGIESRSAQIGHIQRGGAPTLFDRLLATRLGAKAVDLAVEGRYGEVAVLRGEEIRGIPLDDAVSVNKLVTPAWLDLLHTFDPR
ncbi:MAG TPA: ATP-dependent 6-phosphofructokinase [Thermoplasmata archaeon]|nr:ATP-dependent 6-phosphofructokinase [Thermoplasmata archaeon]